MTYQKAEGFGGGTARSTVRAALLGALLALVVQAGVGCAQANVGVATEANSQAVRAECNQRVEQLRASGRITRENARQVSDLSQCPQSAGSVLPAVWMQAQPDSIEIQTLMSASSRARDGRIANVLEAIVKNPSKDDIIRQAAAVVLTGYLRRGISGAVVTSVVSGERWMVEIGTSAHLTPEDASEPPDAGLKDRLIETFTNLQKTSARGTSLQKILPLLIGFVRDSR